MQLFVETVLILALISVGSSLNFIQIFELCVLVSPEILTAEALRTYFERRKIGKWVTKNGNLCSTSKLDPHGVKMGNHMTPNGNAQKMLSSLSPFER